MTQPNLSNRAKLFQKIAAVTKAVGRIPKNGRNDFHKYDYALESDITDGLRDLLADNGLAFLPPSVAEYERGPNDTTKATMHFALGDTETGEVWEFTVIGEGQDKGDKGGYKAYTGAVKYALMKTFLVATGDDPEADTAPKGRQPAQRQQPPVPAPGAAPQRMAPTAAQAPNTPAASAQQANGASAHVVASPKATAAQVTRMITIARGLGWKDEEIKARVQREFGVVSRSEMTVAQVDAFIKIAETPEAATAGVSAKMALGLDGLANV